MTSNSNNDTKTALSLLDLIHCRALYGDKKRHEQHHAWIPSSFIDTINSSPEILSGQNLSQVLKQHQGCVNTVAWSPDGQFLLSGSDDVTLCIWRYEATQSRMIHKIETNHTANIFSAIWLSSENKKIASCSGDATIRLFDLEWDSSSTHIGQHRPWTVYSCHSDRVKRLVQDEASSYCFLSCSEDGTVRQFDQREQSSCSSRTSRCHHLLTKNHGFGLNSISLNSRFPFQFAVAGDNPFVHLYDRRYTKSCLMTLKPTHESISENSHVTGVSFNPHCGEELIASYSSSFVFSFDVIQSEIEMVGRQCLASPTFSKKRPREDFSDTENDRTEEDLINTETYTEADEDISDLYPIENSNTNATPTKQEMLSNYKNATQSSSIPILSHTKIFRGHVNVHTVKDVFYAGSRAEFVVSGSDDGSVFFWSRSSGDILQILYADSEVVNVISPHPSLPIYAISGIDHTIKLFEPVEVVSPYKPASPDYILGIEESSPFSGSPSDTADNDDDSSNDIAGLGTSLPGLPNLANSYSIESRAFEDETSRHSSSSLMKCVNQILKMNERKRKRGLTLRYISARELVQMLAILRDQESDAAEIGPCYVQ